MKKIILILLVLSALAVSALALEMKRDDPFTSDNNQYIREVNLNTNNLTLDIGESYTFSARTIPSNVRDNRLTWTTSNSKVISISDTGRVRAIKNGNATIKVRTSNGKEDSCKITVASGRYTNISLNKRQLNLNIDETYELKANVSNDKIFKSKIYWSSSNNRVATVDSNGKVRARNNGYATITATAEKDGAKTTCSVYVSDNYSNNNNYNNDNLSISLNKNSLNLQVNDDYRLYATIYPNDYNNRKIRWDSSNDRIATVDNNGRVRARSNGQATITVSIDNGRSDSCRVTVGNGRDDNDYIFLNRTNLNLSKGDSYNLIATVPYGGSRNLRWTSSNTSVASVNDNGRVKANRTGTATITVSTRDGRSDSCYVRVGNGSNYDNTQVELNRTNLTLNVGETFTLIAKVRNSPYKIIGFDVWSSNNPRVATIDSNGRITARSSGNATITFKSSNNYKTCYVRVTGDDYYNNNNYDNRDINRDDNNTIKRDNGKEIKREDNNIFKKDNDRNINKDDNNTIKRDDGKEIKREDNKNINKDDNKDVKKEDNNTIKRDDGKEIKREDNNIFKKDNNRNINKDDNNTIKRDDGKEIKREDNKNINKDDNKDVKKEDNNIFKKDKNKDIKKDDSKNINKEDAKDVNKEDNNKKNGFLIRK